MCFYLFGAIEAQSSVRSSFEASIHEVGCFKRPACWLAHLVDINLLVQHLFPHFMSTLPHIRPIPKHTLIHNNPDCEVVTGHSMVLLAQDLRSCNNWLLTHVAQRAWCILAVVGPPDASHSQVSDPSVAIFLQHDVLGLEVSVNDAVVVQELQAYHNAGY